MQLIISGMTLLVITIGLISILFQKKEIHFLTIKKCIDNHRDILRKQQLESGDKNLQFSLLRDHLGLITEELFYMRKNYLPRPLAKDWLWHMIEFVPIIISEEEFVINERQINSSREVFYFLESNIKLEMSESEKAEIKQKNYDDYITLALDRQSFKQIGDVFRISKKQYVKLTGNIDIKPINYNDRIRWKLITYIWKNNKQHTTFCKRNAG